MLGGIGMPECIILLVILMIVVVPIYLAAVAASASRRAKAATNATATYATPSTIAVAAGWLPDPTGEHSLRYWDGRAWTTHVHDGEDGS